MRTDTGSDPRGRASLASRARRGQIIGAATEVVAQLGYANATMARIAERAGISKGVITYHFDSKDEILRRVALDLFERCRKQMAQRIAAASTATEQVRAWISTETEFFAKHRTEFLAMNEIMDNHRDADFSHAFEAEIAKETRGLAEILAQGQRDGEFRAFDTYAVANIILRCKDGVLASWTTDPDMDPSQHAAILLDFIHHAIAND